MIIIKFGGTSVKDADAMSQAIKIVHSRKERNPIVVLSACAGNTDKLLELAKTAPAKSNSDNINIINAIENHHLSIINKLIGDNKIRKDAETAILNLIGELKTLVEGVCLLGECTSRSIDSVLSYGELLSSTVFEAACRENEIHSVLFDARQIIKTDSNFNNANVDFSEIERNALKLKSILNIPEQVIVTQGFIGSNKKNITTTLGRGGSDYSAAIFGSAVNAEEIQIWTDVSGILSADPRLIDNTGTISEISYDEVRELSYYGAKVLHPDTIKPAVEKNIPVRILNTYKPEQKGTKIILKSNNTKPGFHSVVLKENCMLLTSNIIFKTNSFVSFADLIITLIEDDIIILNLFGNENNRSIIIEVNKDIHKKILFEKYGLQAIPVGLLCLCGSGLTMNDGNNETALTKTAKVLSDYSPYGFIYGITDSSIVAIIPPENCLTALKSAHDLIEII